MRRNLRLIPLHQGVIGTMVWIPIMVLFTRARFDLDGAFFLWASYYLSVVILEVPSGWMSDRVSRVPTLRVAAAAWVVAHSCFVFGGDELVVIVIGQFFLAGGFAALSGTDVTFHYDSLEALGKADEYADRQARISAIGYAVRTVSSVAGGALGLIDLRLAFVASLVFAICQLGVTFALVEPPAREMSRAVDGFGEQLRICLGYLRHRFLAWIFFYGIALVTLEHVAETTLQPWLTELLDGSADDVGSAPMLSGLAYAVIAAVGVGAARLSAPLARRFGTIPSLLGLAVLSASIATGMAMWVSAFTLALVILRSVQGAAAPVLISAAVAPRVEREQRATLLSLNSLAGRLQYGLMLLAISRLITDDVGDALAIFTVVSWVLVGLLFVSAAIAIPASERRSSHSVPT